MKKVVIVNAVRTPVGRFGGALTELQQAELGAIVLKEIIKRTVIEPAKVNDVLLGCAYQSGYRLNCARQAVFLGQGFQSRFLPALLIGSVSRDWRQFIRGQWKSRPIMPRLCWPEVRRT